MNKQKWLDIAEVVDAMRLIPRLFMVVYILAVFYTGGWYMGLIDPTTQQTTFATALGSILGVLTGWYYKTGRDWQRSE